MKRSITRLFRPLLCALGLGASLQAQAGFTPVTVTGFTADIVANGTGTVISTTTSDMDGGNVNTRYAFMAPNYVSPTGATPTVSLPATGLINSVATSGLSFQLASYSANNSLRIASTGSGTLSLTTPQASGEVYFLASSGNGASTVTVTVTFTDATTQVFTGQTVADWFGGTGFAIQGIGRVNYDNNTIENNTTDPRLYQIRLPLLPANYTKLVQSIGFAKTSTTGTLNVMAVSLNGVCTGTPTGGTTVASVTSVCASTGFTLSLTGGSSDAGITYQWQSSTDNGVTWTDISGATASTYTVAGQAATTQYRARITCAGSSLTATSAPVTVTTAAPTYAALPVIQSFETTWIDVCNTRDAPSNSWRNSPATGNNSWRREDDPTSAAWTSPTIGLYSPVSSQGSHSARFHSYFAANGALGNLDLYVNLSAAGAKRLSFDFINTSGSDSLIVLLSNDGGLTFGRLGGYKLSATFTTQVLPITSTSATAVLRFRGKSDFGATDIGLDNIVLESATGCLTPASLAATSTTTTTATVTWLTGGTGTYTVLYGPTGFNPATGGTAVTGLTAPPYTITGLTPGTTYQFYVTLNCAGGSNSGTAGPASFNTQIVNDEPCGATVLTINNTCTPLATTTFGATTTASTIYGTGGQGTCSTYTGSHDVWFQFTTAATGPTSTAVRISVTGGAASVVSVYSGTACTGPLTFRQCSGTTVNTAAPNLDLSSLTPSTTYYVRVSEFSSAGTLGNFTICASPIPNCTTPGGLNVTGVTSTSATLNWLAGAAGSTYTVYYGPTGFTPPAGGTTLSGLTGTSTTVTGLTPNTTYQFYVMQVCGGFNGSSTLSAAFPFSTPLAAPANDDPCGAITITNGTTLNSTTVGATTSLPSVIFLPACGGGALPNDVWFAFTPSGTASTLTLTGNASGTVRVYTAASCSAGPFVLVTCRTATAANTSVGTVALTGLTAGQRYYVAVNGAASTDPTGPFTIGATNLLATRAQADTNALLVYPNPSNTGQLALRLTGFSGKAQATLLNALGQVVLTKDLANASTEQLLLTRGLASGPYTLRVAIGDQMLTRKVVLE
ncbi:fibronectin type III domain-containing protein [Hymenobacter rubidus]|uniref:fibronectin type III domain-containing protein n=1 Tax=Hymenobacter rubidus TaxID=1441626 RepID=UPI00191DA714|nr:fibronectin type III domain-containing protein [Hymenobacter rubidus]